MLGCFLQAELQSQGKDRGTREVSPCPDLGQRSREGSWTLRIAKRDGDRLPCSFYPPCASVASELKEQYIPVRDYRRE